MERDVKFLVQPCPLGSQADGFLRRGFGTRGVGLNVPCVTAGQGKYRDKFVGNNSGLFAGGRRRLMMNMGPLWFQKRLLCGHGLRYPLKHVLLRTRRLLFGQEFSRCLTTMINWLRCFSKSCRWKPRLPHYPSENWPSEQSFMHNTSSEMSPPFGFQMKVLLPHLHWVNELLRLFGTPIVKRCS